MSFCFLISVGCTPLDEVAPVESTTKKLPKLYVHCPDDFAPSVKRLREIYNDFESSDDLPQPSVIQVVEVIHGDGPAAHSHYYLAGSNPADAHLTAEAASDQKIHELTIDLFTEFRDIAWLLPNIAADSDMNEKNWVAVKEASGELVEIVERSGKDQLFDTQRKKRIQPDLPQLDSLLSSLEKLIDVSDDSESNPDKG
ncbi:MAG: hypothetical protein AAF623_12365 [Planctomycetota bacterium]